MDSADWIFGGGPSGYITGRGFEIRETETAWLSADELLHLEDCV